MKTVHWLAAAFVAALLACATAPKTATSAIATSAGKPRPAAREDTTLIPRAVLFGNPERARPQLSPDGKQLSFLAPVDGVLNVWVGPADDVDQAKPVTREKLRNIRRYFWSYGGAHILYMQDQGGDENWHIFAVDLAAGTTRDLTPLPSVAAQLVHASPKLVDAILVGLNDRDPKAHDLWRVDVRTGERKRVFTNDKGFAGFVADDDLQVRLGMRMLETGGAEYVDLAASAKPSRSKKPQPAFLSVPHEDSLTTEVLGFDDSGKMLWLLDSRGRNTGALFALDLATQSSKRLAEDPRADVQHVIVHPRTHAVQAAASVYERIEWQIIDQAIAKDLDYLRTVAPGELKVVSRALDDHRWIVSYDAPTGPGRFYLYDRPARAARFLFSQYPALEHLPLAPMKPVVIKSRDELNLVSYLTLPAGSDPENQWVPTQPLPMVLLVHGGPWARDEWGFDATHQWLANRGYAVLSVNFRGSTGFGKRFVNAGDLQWGGRMHDDLVDAVDWAVRQGIADPARVAILGGSYGGYATLVGLTFTPATFACGVDIVGPSNLVTLSETIPPYWQPMVELFARRMGDVRTEEGQALLRARSPLFKVDQIRRPLLIGQGANDPRVKKAESEQIVQAMQTKKLPVTYVLFPNEGHGFAQPANRGAFNAVAEVFLAECLGGAYQSLGEELRRSTITIPIGAEVVPGVATALPAAAPAPASP